MTVGVSVIKDQLLLERARRQRWLVDRNDVRDVGLSNWQWLYRISQGEWIEVVPGLWHHAATPPTRELRIHAASRWLGPQGALFGWSAAAWHDLSDPPETVDFVVPRARRSLTPWVRLHTTRVWVPTDLTTRNGVRVTNTTRTIIDLAGLGAEPRRLADIIDQSIRSRLTSTKRLSERGADLSGCGRRGTLLMRELLLDSGGESCLERRFLMLMRTNGLPRPTCQVIHRERNRTVARVDFEFVGRGVVVEVSGRRGHSSDAERQRDARRRNALQQTGRIVLEFTTADILSDPGYVVATVAQELSARLVIV